MLAALGVGPDAGTERGMVEATLAAEVLYPPAQKEPKTHVGYGIAASASVYAGERFKAMLGLGGDHVVHGWLGDPARPEPARSGAESGTVPDGYRGQLVRITPIVRLGLENDFAYGYVGFAPGYALRVAPLSCAQPPCRRTRAVDSGLNLGVALGAMVTPTRYGLVLGAEVGLDWSWFHDGHPGLAVWGQGMSARLIAGWRL